MGNGKRFRGLFAASVVAAAAALIGPAAASATPPPPPPPPPPPTPPPPPLPYTFPADNQGWETSQDTFTTYAASGWAGGMLSEPDVGDETMCPGAGCMYQSMSSPVGLGSLAAKYGGTWSFDFGSDQVPTDFLQLYVVDTTGDFVFKEVAPGAMTGSRPVSTSLTEPGWDFCAMTCAAATQAQFKGVLAAANYIEIGTDVVQPTDTETYTLDNVQLTDGPLAPAPTPPAASGPTGQRSAALKKCAKIKDKKKKKKCKKRARQLPV